MSRRFTDEVNSTVAAWFPVLKWILVLLVAGIIGVTSFAQGVKSESESLKIELDIQRKINAEQDVKIKETYELMRLISTEQAKISQSMENISQTMIHTMQRVSNDTAEIRMRVDRHIEVHRN